MMEKAKRQQKNIETHEHWFLMICKVIIAIASHSLGSNQFCNSQWGVEVNCVEDQMIKMMKRKKNSLFQKCVLSIFFLPWTFMENPYGAKGEREKITRFSYRF